MGAPQPFDLLLVGEGEDIRVSSILYLGTESLGAIKSERAQIG
jgi:hypothetical protein